MLHPPMAKKLQIGRGAAVCHARLTDAIGLSMMCV